MFPALEYHRINMRPFALSAVALLSALAVCLLLSWPAAAQINGPPASVTSPGFGGRPINGTPPSVTSLGPRGVAPSPHPPLSAAANGFRRGEGHRHHRDSNFVGPVWYAVPVPYAVDSTPPEDQGQAYDDNGDDYQGGPTVFDRRGYGSSSYIPPERDAAPAHAAANSEEAAESESPGPPTVLVFKDGHTLEISNYAIVGSTLYDLTSGHRRKIPLSDLDLDATRKQNDERGVTFELPQSSVGG